MNEKELPAGEYQMVIVNDQRKEKNNLKLKVADGEYEGVIINIKTVV